MALTAERAAKFCLSSIGFIIGYSYCNPDPDTLFEKFPTKRSKFAYITRYNSDNENDNNFNNAYRRLAAFRQGHSEYLFTLLLANASIPEAHVNGIKVDKIDQNLSHIDIVQYASPKAFCCHAASPSIKELINALPAFRTRPRLYKLLVDDSDFTPPLAIENAH